MSEHGLSPASLSLRTGHRACVDQKRRVNNNFLKLHPAPTPLRLSGRLFVFVLMFVTVVYSVNVGLPKFIFASANGLSGHVAGIVIELSGLLIVSVLLILLLVVGHGMLLRILSRCGRLVLAGKPEMLAAAWVL